MAKTQKSNKKIQWIGGIIVVILVLAAVILSNPQLQQGFFKLPSSRDLFREALRRDIIRLAAPADCQLRDITITNNMAGSAPFSPPDPSENRKTKIADFTVTPRSTCTLKSFTFLWSATRQNWEDQALRINMKDMTIYVSVPQSRGDIPEEIQMDNSNLICMRDGEWASFDTVSRTGIAIAPGTPAHVELVSLLFPTRNPEGERINSTYGITLNGINRNNFDRNVRPRLSELTILRSMNVDPEFASLCDII